MYSQNARGSHWSDLNEFEFIIPVCVKRFQLMPEGPSIPKVTTITRIFAGKICFNDDIFSLCDKPYTRGISEFLLEFGCQWLCMVHVEISRESPWISLFFDRGSFPDIFDNARLLFWYLDIPLAISSTDRLGSTLVEASILWKKWGRGMPFCSK